MEYTSTPEDSTENVDVSGMEYDDALAALRRRTARLVNDKRFLDDRLHAHLRVQRAHRVLEDQLQVAALGQGPRLHGPFERLAGVDDAAGRQRHEAENGADEARLAGAGLADDGDGLTYDQETRDLDPDTPRNEFLGRYFDRMSHAENQYPEPGLPGWRTDRGRTYVQLGKPDQELIAGGGETGEPQRLEWRYTNSLPFTVVLRYVNANNFGLYRLDSPSRLVLRNAARRLTAMERSGEWTDARDARNADEEGTG